MSQPTLDLNADLGEGFGPYTLGDDAGLLEVVSSANIACGFHAGDPGTMRRTVERAMEKSVAIGAHPGLPDRLGFGRRRWELDPQDAYDWVVYQVGALEGFVRAAGGRLQHVKPHGALYTMAATDPKLAEAIARAVRHLGGDLVLVALAGSQLEVAGRDAGLSVAREAFADRSYELDGTLTPRSQPKAVLDDPEHAVAQVLQIVRGSIATRSGGTLSLQADTVCLHGDRPHAAAWGKRIRQALEQAGVTIQPPRSRPRSERA
jgi:5-oxoprolinase (ATP-hydrolysing) subunit A